MSWYRDPRLFIFNTGSPILNVCMVNHDLSVGADIPATNAIHFEEYDFSKHLWLGNNNESEYEAFLSNIKSKDKFMINSQGFLGTYDSVTNSFIIFALEDPYSLFLPRIRPQYSDEQHQLSVEKVRELERKNSELEIMNSNLKENDKKLMAQVSDLHEKLRREKAERITEKQALEKKISELTSKLEEICVVGDGSADEEQWMTTGQTVPSNWVGFDDLDVQTFPKDNHLNIIKAIGTPNLAEDNTTNVQSSHFYRGVTVFPIVVVNVAELIPNKEDARFDPAIWSLYRNEGIAYAARKPLESEM